MATWDCKPRTRVKLGILNEYLGAWFSIIATRFKEAIYFDAFCGPGVYATGEDGSPLIALRHASAVCARNPAFRPIIILSDRDAGVLNHLRVKVAELRPHSLINLSIEDGGFDVARKRVLDFRRQRPHIPVFSFVDPFGFKAIPLNFVKDLLSESRSECLVNFMGGWANRFLGHPDGQVAQQVRELLGGDFTQEVLNASEGKRIDAILDIYRRQLSTKAQFVHVFKMYDEGNVNDNALVFAGNSPLGFKKMKEAMWKLDPIYGRSYSAYEDARLHRFNDDLFDRHQEPQTRSLGSLVLKRLGAHGEMTCQELLDWTVKETDFLEQHLRRELTRLEKEDLIAGTDPEGNRRKHTWPDRVRVSLRGRDG